MARAPKTVSACRAAADDVPHASHPSAPAFSLTLRMAYQHATLPPISKAHPHRKQPSAAAPRAAPSTKKVESRAHPVHQLPDLAPAVACDATHKRLSAEAQLVQDQARDSYNARLSNTSDRESLQRLESFPLNITCRAARTKRAASNKRHMPPILPKYFPPSPRKPRSLQFDQDAPQTTQPTNSSGQPLKAVQGDEISFSDDLEQSEDDDFFLDDGQKVGDLLPAGGISLFAHLEDIRVKEARGSQSASSASSSLPRVLSEGTTDAGERELNEAFTSPQDLTEEEIEEWLHVEDSAVLRQAIAEEEQSQHGDVKVAEGEESVDEVDALMAELLLIDAFSMSESGSVDWHADPVTLSEALCESELDTTTHESAIDSGDVDDDIVETFSVDLATDEKEEGSVPCSGFRRMMQRAKRSQELNLRNRKAALAKESEDEEADDWLQVEIPQEQICGRVVCRL